MLWWKGCGGRAVVEGLWWKGCDRKPGEKTVVESRDRKLEASFQL